jgi:hypothetical protein
MNIFVHSFAWIFLLSSAILSLILGKERSVLIQFMICLTLTFLASVITDISAGLNGTLDQIRGIASLFQNPVLTGVYLSLPCLLCWDSILVVN